MKKLIILSLFVAACATTQGPKATATLAATSGSNVSGTVALSEQSDGAVRVTLNLQGVPPGVHGFHIHEKGDCGDNGNAAGGHFNPMSTPHGAPTADPHHAGDFGNVTADANGNVSTSFTTRSITVGPGMHSAVGHALILHANPDDLTSQPSGNAGARIACGVVTLQ
ncbi:MAG TPA: superoxide dismutase family protein [Thermoanaerobaculia bacterium]|jgi:Cu-Zn family superoxide dismutase